MTQTIMLFAQLASGARMYAWMTGAEETDGQGILDARGQIDWCATPHMTIGAPIPDKSPRFGRSDIHRPLCGHLRAFDAYY